MNLKRAVKYDELKPGDVLVGDRNCFIMLARTEARVDYDARPRFKITWLGFDEFNQGLARFDTLPRTKEDEVSDSYVVLFAVRR